MMRTSVVGSIKVLNVGIASVLKIGDSVEVTPNANVLAVQRQVSTFWGNEGDLSQYSVFKQKIPIPLVHESVHIEKVNESPFIRVGRMNISSLSSSAVVQLGSTSQIKTSTRTKHIRHFIEDSTS